MLSVQPVNPSASAPAFTSRRGHPDALAAELVALPDEAGDEAFFSAACRAYCATVQAAHGMLLVPEGHRMRVAGAHGAGRAALGTRAAIPTGSRVGQALHSGRGVSLDPVALAQLPARWTDPLAGGPAECLPLEVCGRTVAVLLAERGQVADAATPADLLERLALIVHTRSTTRAGERRCAERRRRALARRLHDGPVQQLFAVAQALEAEGPAGETVQRCADELTRAREELSAALHELSGPEEVERLPTRAGRLERLRREFADLPLRWELEAEPFDAASTELACAVLREALQNCRKHAEPARVRVSARRAGERLELRVDNDGRLSRPGRGSGVGLRLTEMLAHEHGAELEFGPRDGDGWSLRLVLPGR